MVSFSRRSQILLASSAALFLASCGADDVASPGAGTIPITINPPAPAPTPTPGAGTPAPLTAAEFALATTQAGLAVAPEAQLALVNAGRNNNVNGFGNTLNGVFPVSSTSLTTPGDPTTMGSFFQAANFVGALSGPNDTAFQGWTCNSAPANFGGASAPCTSVPAIGNGGAAAACPAGTSDDGLVEGFRACRLPTIIETSLTLPRIPGVFYRFRGQTEVGRDVGATGADSGVTLTIAPGVTLVADTSEAAPDLLLVNRGSRIQAVGTATNPIIFTSQQNLTAGSVGELTQGQWGGVIVLGRAPVSVCASGTGPNDAAGSSRTCQQQIEGVNNRFYGGPTAADNSGAIQFVQIRYSGIAITPGNELQGLTLGGTGSGTQIDHVHSHNSSDDGIEIFGGTTNLRYFVVTGADDDSYDLDNGWRGFGQFLIAAQKPTPVGPSAGLDAFIMEIDSNNQEDLLPRTYGRFANFTFIMDQTMAPSAIRLRGGADFDFMNGIVRTRTGQTCLNIVGSPAAENTSVATTMRPANPTLQDLGPPTFNSVYFQCQGR